jgi:Mrp family chromosome partitioning ATPase
MLYSLALERCLVLLVVGTPEVQERKSQVAAELALALAEPGQPRVLLLDGDFYRPSVQRMLAVDVPIGAGFSQQLHARVHGGGGRWTVLGLNQSLHAIAEGVMRSPGLLLSQQFDEALREFRGYYDFIVVDGPGTSLDVDGPAVRAIADQVVLVQPSNGSQHLARLESFFAGKRINPVAV